MTMRQNVDCLTGHTHGVNHAKFAGSSTGLLDSCTDFFRIEWYYVALAVFDELQFATLLHDCSLLLMIKMHGKILYTTECMD